MSVRFFEPIVIGHNSFFGVDHLSSSRGQEKAAYFSEPGRILETIEFAHRCGAGGLMMSTHELAAPVAASIKANPRLSESLRIYPLLPYAQKYVTAANEKGLLNVAADTLAQASMADKWSMIWSGAKAVLRKDVKGVITGLIAAELSPFRGLRLPCVFLHDVLTDLALALDLRDVLEFYHEEIEKAFHAKAAFATKNLPLFVRKFEAWGFPAPLAMCHVNKVGFNMNPSREACEGILHNGTATIMAMSTLASGALRPQDAYPYLSQFPRIESVVVGVSSPAHIEETFDAIRQHLKPLFA